ESRIMPNFTEAAQPEESNDELSITKCVAKDTMSQLTEEESSLLAQLRKRAELKTDANDEPLILHQNPAPQANGHVYGQFRIQPINMAVGKPDGTATFVDGGNGKTPTKGPLKFSVRQYDSNTFRPFTYTPKPATSSSRSSLTSRPTVTAAPAAPILETPVAVETSEAVDSNIPADAKQSNEMDGDEAKRDDVVIADDLMKAARNHRRPSTAPSKSNVTWNDRVIRGGDDEQTISEETRPARYSQMNRSKPSLNTILTPEMAAQLPRPPSPPRRGTMRSDDFPLAPEDATLSNSDKVEQPRPQTAAAALENLEGISKNNGPSRGSSRPSTSGSNPLESPKNIQTQPNSSTHGGNLGYSSPSAGNASPSRTVSRPGTANRSTSEANALLTGLRANVANAIAANGSISALPTARGRRNGKNEDGASFPKKRGGKQLGVAFRSKPPVGGNVHTYPAFNNGPQNSNGPRQTAFTVTAASIVPLPAPAAGGAKDGERQPVPHDHTAINRGSHPYRCLCLPSGTLLPHLCRRSKRSKNTSFGMSNRIEFLIGIQDALLHHRRTRGGGEGQWKLASGGGGDVVPGEKFSIQRAFNLKQQQHRSVSTLSHSSAPTGLFRKARQGNGQPNDVDGAEEEEEEDDSNHFRIPVPAHELTPLGLTMAGSAAEDARILAPSCTYGRTDGFKISPRKSRWDEYDSNDDIKVAERMRRKLKISLPAEPSSNSTKAPSTVPRTTPLFTIKDILASSNPSAMPQLTTAPPTSSPSENLHFPPTRYSANKEWFKSTMYITQADPGSNFFIRENERLQRVPYLDDEKSLRKERHQARMSRLAHQVALYNQTSPDFVLGCGAVAKKEEVSQT
ncbi:hypothetical protein HDU97_001126, partial [Phlyctochytrium planicorne]